MDRYELSRRTAAKLLGGGALVALAEMGLVRPAAAQTCEHCTGAGQGTCPEGYTCCGGVEAPPVGAEDFVGAHCIPANRKRFGCHDGVPYRCRRGEEFRVRNDRPRCCDDDGDDCRRAAAICLQEPAAPAS